MELKYFKFHHIIWISLLFNLLAAIFSVGYHDPDEYYQILEFLSLRNGTTTEANMPWEYHHFMRSWFQPLIYEGISKFFGVFGLESPFHLSFLFRLFNAGLSLLGIYSLIPFLKREFTSPGSVNMALLGLNLLWFIPYIHARHSSEAFGAALFMLGFSFFSKSYEKPSFKQVFVAGLFLGASYLARFQMAIPVAFLWFHAIIFRKIPMRFLWGCALSIFIMIFLGILCDFIGYGKWVFSLYHFLSQNLFEDKVSSFGTSPWWWYFTKGILVGVPPLSLALLAGTLWFFIKNSKNPLAFSFIPFLFIHFFIGHKEIRFLFPLFVWMPYFCVKMIDSNQDFFQKIYHKKFVKPLVSFSFILNILALILISVRPAKKSALFFSYIYQHKEIRHIYYIDKDLYRGHFGLFMSYYMPKNLIHEKMENVEDLLKEQKSTYLFTSKLNKNLSLLDDQRCELIKSNYPTFFFQFNIGNWMSRSSVWGLFHCNKEDFKSL